MDTASVIESGKGVQTRYGRMDLPGVEDDLIGRFLHLYGEWAMNEVRFVASALPPGARVADLGAFIGTFSLGLMGLARLDSVCLVEANPVVIPALRANIARNATVPTTIVEAFAAPTWREEVHASVDPDNLGSFSIATPAEAERIPAPGLASRQVTLGQLRAEHGPFDFIKLDIEGAENALLRDDFKAVVTGAAALWMECSEKTESLDLCQTLLDAGLDVFYFAFPVFAADNYNQATEFIFPWAYEAGLWACRGKEPPLSDELKRAGCVLTRIRNCEQLRRALWDTPRWAPADWAGCSEPALAARAAHQVLGHDYADFLSPTWSAGTRDWAKPIPKALMEERDDAIQQLKRTQSVARANEIMLQAERTWIDQQCRAFANDAQQARSAQDQLRHEIALREERLADCREQVAALDERSRALAVIESSNLYRLMLAMRALASRHPALFRMMRPMLVRGWRLARRLMGRRSR